MVFLIFCILTQLHSEIPKLYTILAFLSAIGLKFGIHWNNRISGWCDTDKCFGLDITRINHKIFAKSAISATTPLQWSVSTRLDTCISQNAHIKNCCEVFYNFSDTFWRVMSDISGPYVHVGTLLLYYLLLKACLLCCKWKICRVSSKWQSKN